jgi:hypothetical protein
VRLLLIFGLGSIVLLFLFRGFMDSGFPMDGLYVIIYLTSAEEG